MQGVLCVTESEEGDAPCALMWGAFQGQDGTEGLWGRVDRKSPSKKNPPQSTPLLGTEKTELHTQKPFAPSPAARARCRIRGPQTSPEG